MQSRYSKELPNPFVIDEDVIRKIKILLAKRIGSVKISFDCKNNVSIESDKIDKLVTYENSRDTQIKRIEIRAKSDQTDKYASISWSYQCISINIEASKIVVDRLRTELLDIIEGTKPKYSWLHTNKVAILIFISAMSVFILGFIYLNSILIEMIKKNEATESTMTTFAIGGILLSLFLVMGITSSYWTIHKLCPRAFFLFGQGKSHYKYIGKIRWGIISFFVSILGSLLVGLFFQLHFSS